jgi:WD40 repeat protein
MDFSRGFHTATRLLNGKILILGGVSGANVTETNTVEIYDPGTNQFSNVTPGMIYARAFHTATLLDDGRVLIAGGTVPTGNGTFSSKKAEIYDPTSNGFTALPDMAAYRAAHTATKLDDGRVLILGGNGTDTTIEVFAPDKNDFLDTSRKLLVARRGHTATLLSSTGNVVVMGGGSKTAGLWVTKNGQYVRTNGDPIEERKDHTAAETVSGKILFSGGSRVQGSFILFSQTSEYYDRFANTFLSSAPLLGASTTRHRATTLSDGRILVTGGSNLDPNLSELRMVQLYEEE